MFGNIRTIVKRNKVIDNSCPLNVFSSYLYHATQSLRPLSFLCNVPFNMRSSCDNGAAKNI